MDAQLKRWFNYIQPGDRVQVIGHNQSWPVIRLRENEVEIEVFDCGRCCYRTEIHKADNVIGHLIEHRPKCYRLVWSRNIPMKTRDVE